MIGNIISRLLGEAPTGQRKYQLGILIEVLLFVFLMWGPVTVLEAYGAVAIGAMVTVAGLVIGGNAWEHHTQTRAAQS